MKRLYRTHAFIGWPHGWPHTYLLVSWRSGWLTGPGIQFIFRSRKMFEVGHRLKQGEAAEEGRAVLEELFEIDRKMGALLTEIEASNQDDVPAKEPS